MSSKSICNDGLISVVHVSELFRSFRFQLEYRSSLRQIMPNEQNGKAGKRLHVFETVITDRSDVFKFNGEKVRKNKKEHRCCRPVKGRMGVRMKISRLLRRGLMCCIMGLDRLK